MPYTFVDTIEPPATETMPAEALKINGEYIENQMDARYAKYRTLYVRGREMLTPEITSYETGVRDGSTFQSKRYPERIITIGYSLWASSNYYFRMAFNELCRILDVNNAELIFYDEQDKYYIGTPAGIEEEPDFGSNFVKGEFNIICNDPFKYSVKEYEVEANEDDGNTIVVDYNGTYKAHPVLEADFYDENSCGSDGTQSPSLTGAGDCGFVAWFKPGEEDNEEAKIIQLGDPDEIDIETYEESQTLFSQQWYNITSWTSALNEQWDQNVGDVTSGTKWIRGATGFKIGDSKRNRNLMYAADYGLESETGEHGPTATFNIPADSKGDVGANNWKLSYDLKCTIARDSTASSCMGMFEATVSTASGTIIAGTSVFKESSGTTAKMRAYINNDTVKTVDIDLSYRNERFGANDDDAGFASVKRCTLTKTGDTVDMSLGGTKWSFTDPVIEDMVATKVTLFFGAYKNKTPLYWNGVYFTSFIKNNCDTWQDIPNKFAANDVAVADCTTGEVYVNESPAPEYGAIGNDWEEFILIPGINQIGFSYNDWCKNPPTTKMRYREVYL